MLFGVAAAYFALNTGTGDFQVSNSGFTIALAQPTGAPLAPGNGATQTIDFTVTNNTNQTITLNTETAVIVTDADGGIYDTAANNGVGAWNDSCLASWFTIGWGDGGVPLPRPMVQGSALSAGVITVTMPANTLTNQTACTDASPEVQLSVT